MIFLTGGGTELPERYPQWKLVYGDMEAPTGIMTSLEKLMTGKVVM